ncbi:MAG: hypothetical protein ACK4J0_01030 [Candidatus Anstonellaceae archaeon]
MNSKKILSILLIFLLIFLSGCLGQSVSKGPTNVISSNFLLWWSKWGQPVTIALVLMILISAFSWMYAALFEKEDIKAFVKAEILNLFYSVLILFFVFALVDAAEYITAVLPAYTPIPNTNIGKNWTDFVQYSCQAQPKDYYRPCHIKIAQVYLEILSRNSEAQIIDIMRLYNFISLAMSFSFSFKFILAPATAVSISPFIGLNPIAEFLQFSYDILVKNLIVLKAQQIALDLLHIAFFPYMLSFGIFLRVFHFTRKLGGLLIALAVSFYIVLPLLYVFWGAVLYSFTGPWELDITKTKGFVSQIYFARPELQFYSPNKNSPDYSQGCNDGVISPIEECNEYDKNSLSTPNPKLLTSCPPRDQNGNILSGREKDIYCNYDNCKCISTPYDSSLNVRKDIIQEVGGNALIAENARKYAQICYDQQQNNDQQNSLYMLKAFSNDLFSNINLLGALKAAVLTGLFGPNGILHTIAKIFIFSIFAPFLSLMAALASTKVFSPLLGGDAYIAGLTRLI